MTSTKPKAMEVWARHIPDRLKQTRGWVLWRYAFVGDKWTKPPVNEIGAKIDAHDPDNWMDFSTALQAYQKGDFDGIGFSLNAMEDLAGVDLDHCVTGGVIEPWALEIVEELGGYGEISPSGEGLRVLGYGKLRRDGRKKGNIEMYEAGRYLTVTGHKLDGSNLDLVDFDEALNRVHDRVWSDPPGGKFTTTTTGDAGGVGEDLAERFQALCDDDPVFRERFNSPAAVGARSDHEFHLCARLWEEGFTESEIMILMDSSPQTKWAARDDEYKERTIQKAIFAARERGPISSGEAWPDFEVDDFCFETVDKHGEPVVDADGHQKYTFSPTRASDSIRKKAPLKIAESDPEIYRFDGQIYRNDGARKIDLVLCRVARDRVRGRDVQEVIRRVKNELLEAPVVFDANPYLLGVRNGVVDLRTGEFRDYEPGDLLTDQIDVAYDPSARCPRYLRFLESIQPNVTDRLTLVDWFPATAIRKPLAYVLFLLGIGRNGKGVYENLTKRFFGENSYSTMGLDEINRTVFAAGSLHKKRLWIASEQGSKKKASIGTNFIKLVSGAGTVDADVKNQARIRFEAFFQAIIDTNAMPTIDDTSVGWMERFCKQSFPYIFVDDPDPDNPLERKKDPHLLSKLTTDEELSGILNLLIWRAKEVCETETIIKRPAEDLFAEYTKQSSSLSTFWDEFCDYTPDTPGIQIPTAAIYEAYKRWCSHLVGEVVNEKWFGAFLRKQCKGADPGRKTVNGKKVRFYPGLIFDEDKVNASIEAIDDERTIKDHQGPSKDHHYFPKTNNSKGSGPSRPSNLWNEIIERFGEESPESPYREKISKFDGLDGPDGILDSKQTDSEKFDGPLMGSDGLLMVHHDEGVGRAVVAGDSDPSEPEPYDTIAEGLGEAERREAEYLEHVKTPEPAERAPPKHDDIPDAIRTEALEIIRGLNGKSITFGNVEDYLETRTGEFAPPKAVKRVLDVLASMGATTDKNGVMVLPEGAVG